MANTSQHESEKTPEQIKSMFACRNIVSEAQDVILAHKWCYGTTKVDPHYMYSFLHTLSKKAFTEAQAVYLPLKESGMSRHSLYRCQKAAVDAGILLPTDKKSRAGYPIFVIAFGLLRDWMEKADYEREIQQEMANLNRRPVDPEDAEEEKAGWAEDECSEEDDGLRTVEEFLDRSDGRPAPTYVASVIGVGL